MNKERKKKYRGDKSLSQIGEGKGKKATLLPIDYRHLFLFTYKTNTTFLIKLSGLIFLFFIPLIAYVFFKGYFETGIMGKDPSNYHDLLLFRGYYGFLLIPAFLVMSLGLTGGFYTIRKFAFNEGVILLRDFFKGIKINYKHALIIALIYSGILSLLNFLLNLFNTEATYQYYVPAFIVFVSFLIFSSIVYIYTLAIESIYVVNVPRCIINAFKLTFSNLPRNLLMLIFSIVPFLVCYFVNNSIALIVATTVYAMLGLAHSVLVCFLFCQYCFDKYVNKGDFLPLYRKGLFNEGDNEYVDYGVEDIYE